MSKNAPRDETGKKMVWSIMDNAWITRDQWDAIERQRKLLNRSHTKS